MALQLCPGLSIGVPVGKDSLSMRTRWQDGAQTKQVTAPVSLIVSAFATLDDVRGTLTPQLQPLDDALILVDLGQGRKRLGGSMLAQVLAVFGDEVPDLDDPNLLKSLAAAWGLWQSTQRTPAACILLPMKDPNSYSSSRTWPSGW